MLLHVKFVVVRTVSLIFIELRADRRGTIAKTGGGSVRVRAFISNGTEPDPKTSACSLRDSGWA